MKIVIKYFSKVIRKLNKIVMKHSMTQKHTVEYIELFDNKITIQKLANKVKIKIFDGEKDMGFHKYGNDWYFNRKCPYSFQYLDIDCLYERTYFYGHGHPDQEVGSNLYKYMQEVYMILMKENFTSILELGSGGGELTKQFQQNNLDYFTVEGTKEGFEKLKLIGLPEDRIIYKDLRIFSGFIKKFDIVMCTEVIEHIEPFFASKIIENCIKHSDLVWFSAANRNRKAHYHHMNEQDIEAWDNIFAFMGHSRSVILDGRYGRASRLYISDNLKLG